MKRIILPSTLSGAPIIVNRALVAMRLRDIRDKQIQRDKAWESFLKKNFEVKK